MEWEEVESAVPPFLEVLDLVESEVEAERRSTLLQRLEPRRLKSL